MSDPYSIEQALQDCQKPSLSRRQMAAMRLLSGIIWPGTILAFTFFGTSTALPIENLQKSCTPCDVAGIDPASRPSLAIRWTYPAESESGQVVRRNVEAERELELAHAALKQSLEPLGIQVTLEKKAIIERRVHAQTPLESNRIWLNGSEISMYLPDARTGTVRDAASGAVFQTLQFAGRSFLNVPKELIVQAGLISAGESVKASLADFHAVSEGRVSEECTIQKCSPSVNGCSGPPVAPEKSPSHGSTLKNATGSR